MKIRNLKCRPTCTHAIAKPAILAQELFVAVGLVNVAIEGEKVDIALDEVVVAFIARQIEIGEVR